MDKFIIFKISSQVLEPSAFILENFPIKMDPPSEYYNIAFKPDGKKEWVLSYVWLVDHCPYNFLRELGHQRCPSLSKIKNKYKKKYKFSLGPPYTTR